MDNEIKNIFVGMGVMLGIGLIVACFKLWPDVTWGCFSMMVLILMCYALGKVIRDEI